ncbi:MAG: N-6 DNA methylase [Armatimonadetes bacterium]|nr:N-6 DNA methylase [Armatimonadota bacterium]
MQTRRREIFTTVRTEGGILPADLLQRVVSADRSVEGLSPEDYHLPPGEKINEGINRAWNRLQGSWETFRAAVKKLQKGDPGTRVTRERWLLPLFQELGYGRLQTAKAVEIDGKSYAVSHSWGHAPIHLVSCLVKLDTPTPGVAGAAKSSPHSLTQELLNRSDDHLWAFVSNGKRLRILRDNRSLTRQSYVEFDLESMMEGEAYADFVLLWLLCHESRVEAERPEQCWLEKWSQAAQEQGTRALDQLRDGVEKAITALGKGFLAHPANRDLRDSLRSGSLSTQEYYRQLLRVVYRLLFLFVAEDRELLLDTAAPDEARARYLRFYASSRLRRLAERQRGTRHSDLYAGLRIVLDNLFAGLPALGLPALGSFLFSADATQDLNACEIANHDLLDAIRALAFTLDGRIRRAVDYKNLRSEELGSVYEALLELHPELNADAGTFGLGTAGGSERKTTGSYYTPDSLVQCLLDSALEPIVDEAVKKPNPEQAILDLKVCDPACGSGHFLIAAAHRMAKRLASVRTGDEEPSPEATRTALRHIIGRCVYGVDVNPMAVELCKVALWMEALEPGRPLSFLDHHIQCGNSLLGTTPALIKEGIPDAAFDPIEGDDKAVCAEFKRRNRTEREGQGTLYDANLQPWNRLGDLATGILQISDVPDDTLDGVQARQRQYEDLVRSQGYENGRLLADAWCAAFVWPKTREEDRYPLTTAHLHRILHNPHSLDHSMRAEVRRLAREYRFLHWHLAFPGVFQTAGASTGTEGKNEAVQGWSGGFDLMIGNPPWERVKLQEKEWFAARSPEIANAANSALRQRMIAALKTEDRTLYDAFQADRRRAEGESQYLRRSGRYPLCGRGDVNTYAVFAELFRSLLSPTGAAGVIVPTGIATDDTTKFFFADITNARALKSLYDFENRKALFPAVDSRMKFSLLTMVGVGAAVTAAEFVFFAHGTEDLADPQRRFTLTAEDIALLNPNTRTCPVFRSKRDAELTKSIYRRVPILIRDSDPRGNPWRIKLSRMFDMSTDSHLFRTRDELHAAHGVMHGNSWQVTTTVEVNGRDVSEGRWLPLYEAKLFHQFDHRFATYAPSDSNAVQIEDDRKTDPTVQVMPRYWVHEDEVAEQLDICTERERERERERESNCLVVRLISRSTDIRTIISAVIPTGPVGHKAALIRTGVGC